MRAIIFFVMFTVLLFSCNLLDNSENKEKVIEVKKEVVVNQRISPHCELGIPNDIDTTDDYLIIRPQYIISYNKNTHVCNWVSWNLDNEWYGDEPRYSGNFKVDTMIPEEYYRVNHSDYTNSGYDRGHMVRSEERTQNREDNISTFYLSNIIPQRPDLNRGVWLDFEYYCEDLCKNQNKELYVIAGGIFISDSTLKGEGKVRIPDSCFKIIVILDKDLGFENINSSTEVIAVVMPNIDGIRSDEWEKYKSSIDNIEEYTGYDFLNAIPEEIQEIIEK